MSAQFFRREMCPHNFFWCENVSALSDKGTRRPCGLSFQNFLRKMYFYVKCANWGSLVQPKFQAHCATGRRNIPVWNIRESPIPLDLKYSGKCGLKCLSGWPVLVKTTLGWDFLNVENYCTIKKTGNVRMSKYPR